MNVLTKQGRFLDMVEFHIDTGAIYDGPQIVIAHLIVASQGKNDECDLVFEIIDDSRCMCEKVQVTASWPLIRACQNGKKLPGSVHVMAQRIMNEYLASRYVY